MSCFAPEPDAGATYLPDNLRICLHCPWDEALLQGSAPLFDRVQFGGAAEAGVGEYIEVLRELIEEGI